MFDVEQYQLLDFGGGQKLERFGACLLQRPSPAADGIVPHDPSTWQQAHARFTRTAANEGQWSIEGPPFDKAEAEEPGFRWTVHHPPVVFELRLTDFGHVGLFPEQADNWDWLARQVRQSATALRILNLFAYTGGATLAAAAAGAEVVHVDASRSTVDWARRNAHLSGLAGKPIRWIVDDSMKFVEREVRRGRRYNAIVLDPPSWGHGPTGESWKLSEHLPALLERCSRLTGADPRLVLLTCHTPGYGPTELSEAIREAFFAGAHREVQASRLTIESAAGLAIDCGSAARWPA